MWPEAVVCRARVVMKDSVELTYLKCIIRDQYMLHDYRVLYEGRLFSEQLD